MLEGLVKEGSFKWLLGNRNSFDEEFEDMSKPPTARRNWILEFSPIANVVLRRCSRIIGISLDNLRDNFGVEASDSIKNPSRYARNFLEYCCFRALALSTQVNDYIADKKFPRLTYDMMLAWEAPAASSEPFPKLDEERTVGGESFSRIAPSIPLIADVITSDNLFNALTTSTGGRLQFSVYEKYLNGLERATRKFKTQSESSLLSAFRSPKGEKILEVDGTVTTQPVLQHVGTATWPGRLTLTDHALYFEPLKVMSFNKPKAYDLSGDLKQVVKPELIGPWGTRLFDKAVMYKAISLPEPVVMEFPELKGHTRRDYWLAIIREILYAHRFAKKFQFKGVQRDEALSRAVLGILRLQAVQELSHTGSVRNEALLMFNLCDQIPGGDLILETLARMFSSMDLDRTNNSTDGSSRYSISALVMMSNLEDAVGTSSIIPKETRLIVGEMVVGEITALERIVRDSRNSFKKVELAQETVNRVKVEGIDTNLAVMKGMAGVCICIAASVHCSIYGAYTMLSPRGAC
uniref:Uncharacterized protein n=1 Tax=Nelumbo nucifera TaxID=4432 RepID=A0A822YLE4_NELNU|nr:TPA_asm: hypothetical protein HUJ06_010656 [Nelumbo nucifera]